MSTSDEHAGHTQDAEHHEHAVNRGHEDVPSDYEQGTGPSHRTTPNREGVNPVDSAAAVNPSGGPQIHADDAEDAGDAVPEA